MFHSTPRLSFLSPQPAVSQRLPAGTRCFLDLRQHQFVAFGCRAPLQSAPPPRSPTFPVLCTLLLLPWTSRAVQARRLGPTWADQVFYYHLFQQPLQLSSCPCVTTRLASFCCVICFMQASYCFSFWSWSEEQLWLFSSHTHLHITFLIQTLDLSVWGLAAFTAAVQQHPYSPLGSGHFIFCPQVAHHFVWDSPEVGSWHCAGSSRVSKPVSLFPENR